MAIIINRSVIWNFIRHTVSSVFWTRLETPLMKERQAEREHVRNYSFGFFFHHLFQLSAIGILIFFPVRGNDATYRCTVYEIARHFVEWTGYPGEKQIALVAIDRTSLSFSFDADCAEEPADGTSEYCIFLFLRFFNCDSLSKSESNDVANSRL